MNLISPQHPRPATNGHPADVTPSAHEIHYQQDAAHYVAAMIAELRMISGKAGFGKLVSALDAAYYEAYSVSGGRPRINAEGSPGALPEKISDPAEPTAG